MEAEDGEKEGKDVRLSRALAVRSTPSAYLTIGIGIGEEPLIWHGMLFPYQ